ncbi:MAG: HPr family phosphocarrier protein [Burkholderiales bacterium]|jgi:phosphocarrier protein|nr:HPr family phosphocarrier protein [Burkholderiales bacterium]
MMITQEVEIINKLGLHARASSKLVSLANNFESNLTIIKDAKTANLKSIMGVMMLAVSRGNKVQLAAEGNDARLAIEAMVDLINNKFGEEE